MQPTHENAPGMSQALPAGYTFQQLLDEVFKRGALGTPARQRYLMPLLCEVKAEIDDTAAYESVHNFGSQDAPEDTPEDTRRARYDAMASAFASIMAARVEDISIFPKPEEHTRILQAVSSELSDVMSEFDIFNPYTLRKFYTALRLHIDELRAARREAAARFTSPTDLETE